MSEMSSQREVLPRVIEAVRRYDKRTRRAILAGLGAAVVGWVAAFLFYALLKSFDHQSVAKNVLLLLAQSLYVGSPVFGFLVYGEAVRAKGVLVWLRRFRADYGERMRFHRCLGGACTAIVNPITIQDKSFRSSFFSAVLRSWLLFPALLALWSAGFLFLAVLAILVLPMSRDSGAIVVGGVALFWTVLFGWAVWQYLRRMGFTAISGNEGIRSAEKRFESLRDVGGRGMGVQVLRCDDEIWKEVVACALSRADIAVIDVSEPSENVLWELSQARKHLRPSSILLVCEDPPGEDRIRGQLGIVRGDEPMMNYPAQQAPVGPGRGRQYTELAIRLRQEIAQRIESR